MLLPILISTNDTKFSERCDILAKNLKINSTVIIDLDSLDIEQDQNFSCCIIDCRNAELNQLSGFAQIASQLFGDAKNILVINNKIKPEELKFIYQSGANLIINENDFFNYSKIDFYMNYILNNTWIPVKAWDFEADKNVPFDIYHFIPYKNKFFNLNNHPDGFISANKLQKMKDVGELYIKRTDLRLFSKYVSECNFEKADGLLRRCRAKYLEFYDNYIELSFQLSDDSKHYTFEEGKKMLDKTQALSSELLSVLASAGDPWLIVNNLTFELDGQLSRVPAIASYVGISALLMDLPNPAEVMFAALIGDLGLLRMSPKHFKQDFNNLSEEDQNAYINHPLLSVNLVLERKLPITDKIRHIILNSHENILGKGFPKGNKCVRDKISIESQLIQVCEQLDQKLIIKPGEMRPKIDDVKAQLIGDLEKSGTLTPQFLERIRQSWVLLKIAA